MGKGAVVTPERSLEQRREALRKANDTRVKRAALKKDVKEGLTDVCVILGEPPAFVATMKVVDLLRAIPKYGQVKATKTLHKAYISPSKTVGGMSMRQRGGLIKLIRESD